jgi:hypothetical protein
MTIVFSSMLQWRWVEPLLAVAATFAIAALGLRRIAPGFRRRQAVADIAGRFKTGTR